MFRHRLDDELAVVAEKEEATTPSCPFTCLEDLILIRIRAQTVLKHFLVAVIVLECFHEELTSMEGDLDIASVGHRLIHKRACSRFCPEGCLLIILCNTASCNFTSDFLENVFRFAPHSIVLN